MKKKAKQRSPRKNKKAFDSVMRHLRQMHTIHPMRAVNFNAGGAASINPSKPTPIDFICDVDVVIRETLPPHVSRLKVYLTYVVNASDDELEQEKYADAVFGNIRHQFEQSLGLAFIRRGLFPVQGKGYFHTVR